AAVGRTATVARRAADQAALREVKMSRRTTVDVKETISRIVGDVDVRLAIAVNIHEQNAKSLAGVWPAGPQASLDAHIGEGAVAVVAEELVSQAIEDLRRANIRRSAAARMIGERPVDVMADVQVGIAIAVEVRPAGAGTPRLRVQSRLARHIDESPSLRVILGIDGLVVEQGQPSPTREEQVRPAVAVEITHGRAVTVEPTAVHVQTLADIGKLAVAEVAIQFARSTADFLTLERTAAR